MGLETGLKLPVPSPNKIVTAPVGVQLLRFIQLSAIARSNLPSPLKSPEAIATASTLEEKAGAAKKFPRPSLSRIVTLPALPQALRLARSEEHTSELQSRFD